MTLASTSPARSWEGVLLKPVETESGHFILARWDYAAKKWIRSKAPWEKYMKADDLSPGELETISPVPNYERELEPLPKEHAMSDQDGMDLQAFVRETILQVVRAVAEVKAEIEAVDSSSVVNPVVSHAVHGEAQDIEFDVALTTRRSKEGGGKAGIKLAVFSADGDGKIKSDQESVSRVKFKVPIALPATPRDRYPSNPGEKGPIAKFQRSALSD